MAESGLEKFERNFPGKKLKVNPLPTIKIPNMQGEIEEVTLHPADKSDPRTLVARDAEGNEVKLDKTYQGLADSVDPKNK